MIQEYNNYYIPVNNNNCYTEDNLCCSFPKMKFGERLRAARKHAGITQQQLSDRLGKDASDEPLMTQANISRMEIDENAIGSLMTCQIARACGVSPDWLASEVGEMLDGIYVTDPKLKAAVALMQEMPGYALDAEIKRLYETKKLIEDATNAAREDKSVATTNSTPPKI